MAAVICLGIIAAAALIGLGWSQWCQISTTKSLTKVFSEALTRANQAQSEVVATLVLGYRDSTPPNAPLPTELSESETKLLDVNSLDDMPDHIKEAYLREAEEDAMMMRTSLTPSSTPLSTSS